MSSNPDSYATSYATSLIGDCERESRRTRSARARMVISSSVPILMREPAAIGQVINIGNVQEVTITDLAKLVRDLSGSNSTIKYVPYDEAYESGFEDMPRRVPDLTRAKGLIGYEPKHDLDDILTQVIEYFRKK